MVAREGRQPIAGSSRAEEGLRVTCVAPWPQGTPTHLPAEVLVKRKKRLRGGGETWEVVRARGHLDEVQELRASVAPGEHCGRAQHVTCMCVQALCT